MLTVADWNYLEGARVLAPAGVLLNLARLQHWEARYDHPSHPSPLLQKPTLKNHRRRERGRERERWPFLSPPLLSISVRRVLTGSEENEGPFFLALPAVLGGFIWFFSSSVFSFASFAWILKVLKLICGKP